MFITVQKLIKTSLQPIFGTEILKSSTRLYILKKTQFVPHRKYPISR
jgi:hypothetical protein